MRGHEWFFVGLLSTVVLPLLLFGATDILYNKRVKMMFSKRKKEQGQEKEKRIASLEESCKALRGEVQGLTKAKVSERFTVTLPLIIDGKVICTRCKHYHNAAGLYTHRGGDRNSECFCLAAPKQVSEHLHFVLGVKETTADWPFCGELNRVGDCALYEAKDDDPETT